MVGLQAIAFVYVCNWQEPGGNLGDLIEGKKATLFSGLGVLFVHNRFFNAVLHIYCGVNLLILGLSLVLVNILGDKTLAL